MTRASLRSRLSTLADQQGGTRIRALSLPLRYGSESRKYRPDFIVLVDDGQSDKDLLHLIVEITGYRREDAKEKKSTTDT